MKHAMISQLPVLPFTLAKHNSSLILGYISATVVLEEIDRERDFLVKKICFLKNTLRLFREHSSFPHRFFFFLLNTVKFCFNSQPTRKLEKYCCILYFFF